MAHGTYYVPHSTRWPIVGSIGMFTLMIGAATLLNGAGAGSWFMIAGAAILVFMMFGWLGTVIRESESGVYSNQVDSSFRQGMVWFIFSEVMFFAAFFGALFYARLFAVPWLGGEGTGAMTNELLYPGYSATWPTGGPEQLGGEFRTIPAFDIPLLNTLLLLSSGFTITMAHWALKKMQRAALVLWMLATIALGAVFLYFQATEYIHAYKDLGLTLGSGIYGSTFFMLTGFHGLHVIIGALTLPMMGQTASSKLVAAAQLLQADLAMARSESLAHPDDLRLVVFDTSEHAYRIASASTPATPITEEATGKPYRVRFGEGRAQPLGGVTISNLSVGGDDQLGFEAWGNLDQTTDATITLALEGRTIDVSVDPDTGEATVGSVQ